MKAENSEGHIDGSPLNVMLLGLQNLDLSSKL